MLVEFSLACISTTCGKNFSIYGVHIPRKCIKSMHINSCPSPSPKTPGRSFWKYVSLKTKWVKESMIYFVKTQSENMKMTKNISLFIFCMICNFCKCDGCTVLWIISVCVYTCVMSYGSYLRLFHYCIVLVSIAVQFITHAQTTQNAENNPQRPKKERNCRKISRKNQEQ